MATLIAVKNLAVEGSTCVGGQLFTNVFDNHLAPLILVAAATSGACVFLVPLFRKSLKPAKQD